MEGPHGDSGDEHETQRGEEDTAVAEGLGKEHDTRSYEGLQQGEEGLGSARIALLPQHAGGPPAHVLGTPTDERAVLSRLLVILGLVVRGGLVVCSDGVLVVRVGKVFTSKGTVEIQKFDKVPGNGDAGATREAGARPPVVLQDVVTTEALDLIDLGDGQMVVRELCPIWVGEGHGALDARMLFLGGDFEQVAMDVTTLEMEGGLGREAIVVGPAMERG